MKPTDLKTDAEWDALLREFSSDCGMAVLLTDDKGEVVRESGERFPLCTAIRNNDGAATFICSQTNTAMLQTVRAELQPVIDICEAGLYRVVVPIVRDGSLVGQVAACGLAPEDEEFDPFLVARVLEIDEDEVVELFGDTRPGSEEEIMAAARALFDELGG
jgi:ligand-binding sensor protein